MEKASPGMWFLLPYGDYREDRYKERRNVISFPYIENPKRCYTDHFVMKYCYYRTATYTSSIIFMPA